MSPPIHRIGLGTDVHRLVDGRPLKLGGVLVPSDRGPLAHSDGDVVLHALIDALSGAVGLPDIGDRFPDTDPRYKDADSRTLLAETLRSVRERGWAVVNADIVIMLEEPKLSPHKTAIARSVAALLGVASDGVSVKAKTNEGLDALGRGEALACTAVVALTQL